MLNPKEYYKVIEKTTLLSVDLICINNGKILMGKRNNEPAKNFLFTPGSRVYKYEKQNDVIIRIGKNEMGIDLNNKHTTLLGPYDHIYNNNFIDDSFGTHYLTNAYIINLNDEDCKNIVSDDQHDKLEWYDLHESMHNEKVHPYVKWFIRDYLQMNCDNNENSYENSNKKYWSFLDYSTESE